MCVQPAIRAPARGFSPLVLCLKAITPVISKNRKLKTTTRVEIIHLNKYNDVQYLVRRSQFLSGQTERD